MMRDHHSIFFNRPPPFLLSLSSSQFFICHVKRKNKQSNCWSPPFVCFRKQPRGCCLDLSIFCLSFVEGRTHMYCIFYFILIVVRVCLFCVFFFVCALRFVYRLSNTCLLEKSLSHLLILFLIKQLIFQDFLNSLLQRGILLLWRK